MRAHLHIFQHVPFEDAEHIAVWAQQRDFTISHTRWFAGEQAPAVTDVDWLVIMGGPMNIYQHQAHPWLVAEKRWIQEAISLRKKIVGVCLGAQLLADALGAKVHPNAHQEIGWFPVRWTTAATARIPQLPVEKTVFHWHGDTFELPAGSERLASSCACRNQGFVYQDHLLAFQFHIESSRSSVATLCENCGEELVDGTYIQSAQSIRTDQNHFASNQLLLTAWLDWLSQA